MVGAVSWRLVDGSCFLGTVKWHTIMHDCLAIHLVLNALEIAVQLAGAQNNCRNSPMYLNDVR